MVRYGIIGSGMMGQEHIRNIHLLPDSEVCAICEPDPGMQQRSLELAPAARSIKLIEELPVEQLDALVIASPNYLHTEHLRQVAAFAELPVMVEKPLATTAEDQQFLEQFQRDYNAPVWVAMEYRYMPPIARFIQQVQASTGGVTMLSIREHRYPFLEKVNDWNRFNRFSGGTFVEKCCHFFDLMRLITAAEPVRIMASAGQVHNHLDEQYAEGTPDIWDSGFVIVDFDNGSRAMLDLCMYADGSRYEEELCAVGPEGKIECHVPGPTRFWPTERGEPPVAKIVTSPRYPEVPDEVEVPVEAVLLEAGSHNGATFYQHEKFQQVVLGGAQPEVTLQDGWKAVSMGMAAQHSATTGQCVSLK